MKRNISERDKEIKELEDGLSDFEAVRNELERLR